MEGYRRPYVTVSAAATIDGKIATKSGDSAISSRRDLARVHRLRAAHDAVLVGAGTVLADDPLLTVRYAQGRSPARVVLDPAGRTPSGSRLLLTCGDVRTILVVTSQTDARNRRRLEGAGATVLVEEDGIRLGPLLGRLYGMGVRTLLVEGGGRTIWGFVSEGVFDEMVLTISPHIAGGGGTSLVGGEGFAGMADGPGLELLSVRRQGDEVVLHYARTGMGDGPDRVVGPGC